MIPPPRRRGYRVKAISYMMCDMYVVVDMFINQDELQNEMYLYENETLNVLTALNRHKSSNTLSN